MLKIERTLWEDISNMRWAQKLSQSRLLSCNSTTNWENNSSPGPHTMENGLCKYGEIWIDMDKFNWKKTKMAVRTISQFFHIVTKTRLSEKQSLPVRRYHRALCKWQTGPVLTHLICYNLKSENEKFENRSKNTWNFQETNFDQKNLYEWKF